MPEPIPGFDYDARNGHFHFPREYGSRLSWPLQQTSNDSPATATMIPKRSTSPLPLPMDSNNYQQTAPYPPSSIMADWPVTSQAPPVSYPLDTTSFSQQPFDTFGTSFQASPTEYLTQHATLEASLEANMNSNMNPALPMDQTYMANAISMQNEMNGMSPNMNLAQLPLHWPPAPEMNLYDLQNMQDLMAQQQPLGQMGSPSDTFSETYEVRSLSSSDHSYGMVERVDPHPGAVFNPQRTLHHPRTYSDSSSDNGQHSLGSYEIVDFSNCASSPSNESTGELNFPSDPENVPYWETERQSPPLVAMSHAVIKPISTDQPLPTSPQRSPVSPPGRSRPRKNTTSKTTASAKVISKKQNVQGTKPETTEKRVGRRKGPLRPDQRKQASEIRKLGACIRCRFLKKTVSLY